MEAKTASICVENPSFMFCKMFVNFFIVLLYFDNCSIKFPLCYILKTVTKLNIVLNCKEVCHCLQIANK